MYPSPLSSSEDAEIRSKIINGSIRLASVVSILSIILSLLLLPSISFIALIRVSPRGSFNFFFAQTHGRKTLIHFAFFLFFPHVRSFTFSLSVFHTRLHTSPSLPPSPPHTHTHISFSLSRLAGSFDAVPCSVVTRRSSRRDTSACSRWKWTRVRAISKNNRTCSYIYRLHLPWTISRRCCITFYDLGRDSHIRMSSPLLPTEIPVSQHLFPFLSYALQHQVCTWIVNILGRENDRNTVVRNWPW